MSDAVGHRTVLLVSHLTPTLGLERCVLSLAERTGLPIVAIGDDPARWGDSAPTASATTLGAPLRGLRRIASVLRLFRWLRAAPYDQIVACGIWAAVPLLAVARSNQHRIIVWEHSLTRGKLGSSPTLRLLGRAARVLYRRSSIVVAVSEELAEELREWLTTPDVLTIPNYLPEKPPTAGLGSASGNAASRTRTRLLSVGSLTATKNHAALVRALALLPDSVELFVLGEGPERTDLQALIDGLGLSHRAQLLGYVPDPSNYLAEADVVVHPSLGETFGLALFEAAAYHVPVVTLDYPLTRRLVPDMIPGILTDDDPRRIATAVKQLLAEPYSREAWTSADLTREQRFGSARITQQWNDILNADKVAP
jgi:glycosyltransferase involved in cell wall biosynthesis